MQAGSFLRVAIIASSVIAVAISAASAQQIPSLGNPNQPSNPTPAVLAMKGVKSGNGIKVTYTCAPGAGPLSVQKSGNGGTTWSLVWGTAVNSDDPKCKTERTGTVPCTSLGTGSWHLRLKQWNTFTAPIGPFAC